MFPPPLSTNPRFMHVLLQSNPTETAARQIDIRQTPCLKLTGRRCWRYPENTRISRGWQSGSCVLGVGASSSSHPPLRPACDHDISRQEPPPPGKEEERRRRQMAAPRERRRPRRPAPVTPSATEPAPHVRPAYLASPTPRATRARPRAPSGLNPNGS